MPHLTYHEALAAIAGRERFGVKLGLERVRALLSGLGDPQLGIRGALVAGTNGKGSTLALVASALRRAGYRVGETPKPHLVTYRERLQISGAPIAPEAFAALVEGVLPLADRVAAEHGEPTEFELLTAMMFRWFADERVDLAVVEVGLGGRLDATHAWDGGVAAITNVDLDHTDRLGPTIVDIAREKAAIIEAGDLAVTGATGEALAVIEDRARSVGAPLRIVTPAPVVEVRRDGIDVELPRLGRTRIGLSGRHQAANAAVADAVLDALEEAGIATVGPANRRAGYAAASWPGRLELLTVAGAAGRPVQVVLDGAHNPAGAAALATALDELVPQLGLAAEPVTLVFATMADKDVDGMIRALLRSKSLAGARVIATAVDAARALSPDALAARWWDLAPAGTEIQTAADPEHALEVALAAGGDGRLVVVAGSLYLVGAARARLVDDPLLRDPPPATTIRGS
jgi:dihydrofolate synthase/folylpolyglutamate synthase